jgi:hypothetical protein
MAKDPAVLFYTSDFICGTEFFTYEQKGQYIHLLCFQHQSGHLTTEYMEKILGSNGNPVWSKFIQDDKTLWFNERMDDEKLKRNNYVESRRNIGKLGGRPSKDNLKVNHKAKHMPNLMGNENENINRLKDKRKKEVNIIKTLLVDKTYNRGEFDFSLVWSKYPKKLGKTAAERHFNATVKTKQDMESIQKALTNFLGSSVCSGDTKYIPHGGTWFNNWKDWVEYKEPENEFTKQENRRIELERLGIK